MAHRVERTITFGLNSFIKHQFTGFFEKPVLKNYIFRSIYCIKKKKYLINKEKIDIIQTNRKKY